MATCEKRQIAQAEYVMALSEFEARALREVTRAEVTRNPYISYTQAILRALDEVLR